MSLTSIARIATSASHSGETTDSAMHGRRMKSICSGVRHIEMSVSNMILIDGECLIGGVCEIGDLNVKSLKMAQATIHLNTRIEQDEMNGGSVIVFVDDSLSMDLVMKSTIVSAESGELKMTETTFDGICTTAPFLSYTKEGKISMSEIGGMKRRGGMGDICECVDVRVGLRAIDGEEGDEKEEEGMEVNEMRERDDEICRWKGSLVDISNCSVLTKDTTIMNSQEGGVTMSG
ncbi:uncharacterized protein MONOS_12990 [Monocercomonoides exilis]|uniref:uncharacterized protein n=1 Tax=Monocercomonoides exilis TaxID=2049356 RepID=UPI00355A83C2|nr:hypothetical protein MONOS_12990 [Monocercomonoides exilis]|eukprot:MONOS_12990.1-p1 / transcript=MONOS_12990.1 / gene=MONOS_12990 / organism=Monocercomonoides_exilis_PA203 / gene_product=unspecified product / transcript_product=unspecified product / location=Mono_scaffold00763:28754-29737(-) / protein_length=233 / sequence_SO=supercontig / SO=protein_coding / is_pseudo=false